jgi:hypothetical protein
MHPPPWHTSLKCTSNSSFQERERSGGRKGAAHSDVRTPIHTLARARPRSPQAVLASTQPIIASYNDARCGCDAAVRLRCPGSGAKWARANRAAGGTMCTGARCVAPSPPRHLARSQAGLLRGGEGWRRPVGAFISCSYYALWSGQHATPECSSQREAIRHSRS